MQNVTTISRIRVRIRGAVQGVGFRPFIYRLATELELTGWVNNGTQGVLIEVEGDEQNLSAFIDRLQAEKPPHAILREVTIDDLMPIGFSTFDIHHSDDTGEKTAFVLPDLATCPDCLAEVFDPNNRRYLYPFTNCTNCGPRYTIINDLPYDRPLTSMKHFVMCPDCQAEYDNPLDRRFHAQPNACPTCGPKLELWSRAGDSLSTHHQAVLATVDAIKNGQIVALKGLGGFHLMVDAYNADAINHLRQRKQRKDKPFALMYPSIETVKRDCVVSELEEDLLISAEAPIVLLRKRDDCQVAKNVAPDNPYLGVMLPYTPLHHILLHELSCPIVATSGNLSDEPICTDEHDARARLGAIADIFLVHNRPIVRHCDDSIVRVLAGETQILRRARGYAPLPISVTQNLPSALAVGAHQKNTVAIAINQDVFISQHIGDLETYQSIQAFERTSNDLQHLYDFEPDIMACDLHPDYTSTHYAQKSRLPLVPVQHHYAHVLACMAENNIDTPVLGVVWDGTGYGRDGTIWGGEFLLIDEMGFQRVAHLRQFKLAGGDKAIREPRRSALGLLYALFGEDAFNMQSASLSAMTNTEQNIIKSMLEKDINAPLTSSVGRLFDAVSSLIGLCQQASYEGQAAMQLEFCAHEHTQDSYTFELVKPPNQPYILDWEPMIRAILSDIDNNIHQALIAGKFHNTLVDMILTVARRMNINQIVLTGGCFQNARLSEQAITRLREANYTPYWHHQVPPNDGGIALGQIMATQLSS